MIDDELQNLINHIPWKRDYPGAELMITLPTTSKVTPARALEVVHQYALPKGWKIEEITIMKRAGYIACDDCHRSIHIHISHEGSITCLNCEGKNIHYSQAEVNIVRSPDTS